MNSIYIIGDVHGCYDTLVKLLGKIPKDAKICFVGDLIDRGPKSKEVIELIRSKKYDCVKGNHEDLMSNNSSGSISEHWYKNGGRKTVSSYKGDLERLKDDSIWVKDLPIYIEYPEYKTKDGRKLVVSHSSILVDWHYRNIIDISDTVMWNRDVISEIKGEHKLKDPKEIFNIFGHSMLKEVFIDEKMAAIDTGAFSNRVGYGKLTAIKFPEMEIIEQELIDEI